MAAGPAHFLSDGLRHPGAGAMVAMADGARLTALRDLAILDTEPEEEFDRFTRLTADLLGVPVSLVSLLDSDRQFFKSQHGLADPWAAARQTPLSHSFCQHAVAGGRPLVIEDARLSAVTRGNLAIRDLDVIAYAGMPLVLGDGHAVGTLCAIDRRPHDWTGFELRILEDLSHAVTTQLDLRRALAAQALNDRLTGLPNRALTSALCDRLRSARRDRRVLGLVVAIDDIASISLDYGVTHADRVMQRVSRRIAWQLSPDDVLGRIRPDAFIVVRPDVEDEREALELARRLRDGVCGETLTVNGASLSVGVTVGIAYGEAEVAGDELIVRAEQALRDSTGLRRPIQIGAGEHRQRPDLTTRERIRSALRGAVSRAEISVVFQPFVDLQTRRTLGFEALARWRHPELGEVSPTDFIPIAEATGDVVAIGEHVLDTGCRQLSDWRAQFDEGLRLTVNLSPVQLAVPNIVEIIRAILDHHGLPASALALELTESVLLAPGRLELASLEALRGLGIQIALDDFGTGHSSMSHLKSFAIDVIKIDSSFLEDRHADFRDQALVRSMLALGSGLEIDVVAEGVETDSQRDLLCRSGCRYGQGYLFARPLPADQVQIGAAEITPEAIIGLA